MGGGVINEWVSELVVFPYSSTVHVQCPARLHAQLDNHKNGKTGLYEYRAATSQHISPSPLTSSLTPLKVSRSFYWLFRTLRLWHSRALCGGYSGDK